jgi:AraC-like DNA-binding protein
MCPAVKNNQADYSLQLVQPFLLRFLEQFKELDDEIMIPNAVGTDMLRVSGDFIGKPDFILEVTRSISPGDYSVREYKAYVARFINRFKQLDADTRIPITIAHDILKIAVEFLSDPDIGLKAGRTLNLGNIGALDFAISSAATVRQAIEVASRYMRLIGEGFTIRLELIGNRAMVRFESPILLPRYIEDFQISAFYKIHSSSIMRDIPEVEFWFVNPKPENTIEYEHTFGESVVRFGAPVCGILFSRECLELPLYTANSRLHSVLCSYAELVIKEEPDTPYVTKTVRNLILKELPQGEPSITHIAHLMRISPRTLGRRLEREGMTFKTVLDDLRKDLASQYVARREFSLSEVSFLLGYSNNAAFHRAFKRWMGMTPFTYRFAKRR